jgi:Na+/H+-dicarboxylate symporter
MLTSKGVAGVPRAALVILLGTVSSFNLPAEPVFIILGIDALMDMARTGTNVLGNCLATVVHCTAGRVFSSKIPSSKFQAPIRFEVRAAACASFTVGVTNHRSDDI